jgi:adenylate cyclase
MTGPVPAPAISGTAPPAGPARRPGIDPATLLRDLRLYSGLIMFSYVLTHFLNHALGLVSLRLMEQGAEAFTAFWRHPVASVSLYGAIAIHLALAFWSIFRRRSLLGMHGWEMAQLGFGLTIPYLLIEHIVGTRFLSAAYGLDDRYLYVLLVQWVLAPSYAAMQSLSVLVVWLHACIGLHFWLRVKPWYGAAVPFLYAAALLVPVLALLGFYEAGMAVRVMAEEPGWVRETIALLRFPSGEQAGTGRALADGILYGLGGLLVLTLIARPVRDALERHRSAVRITYPGGRAIQVPRGTTILDASRLAGIPHASVCGGRGRCSTCRVRVMRGLDALPPASAEETKVLERVAATPAVRLACQTRPEKDIEIVPLLPPTATASDGYRKPAYLGGQERDIAVLFADMRAFTRFSENRLPYDVVFVLNRYFNEMGMAVERAGGRIDKFIGDGVMALFGVEGDPARGCRQALEGARAMSANLEALNAALKHDLEQPLRIGIGIHVGPTIVGEMGYARATSVTAIGDTVNTASRLESTTKEFGAELIVSDDVAARAGVDLSAFPHHEVEIRGRRQPLAVRVIPKATDLPTYS